MYCTFVFTRGGSWQGSCWQVINETLHWCVPVGISQLITNCVKYTLLKSDVTRRDHVVRCYGSQECWFTHHQFHCQFHSRWYSLHITVKSTTLLFMHSSNTWTTKPWQWSEWRLGFNSVYIEFKDLVWVHLTAKKKKVPCCGKGTIDWFLPFGISALPRGPTVMTRNQSRDFVFKEVSDPILFSHKSLPVCNTTVQWTFEGCSWHYLVSLL